MFVSVIVMEDNFEPQPPHHPRFHSYLAAASLSDCWFRVFNAVTCTYISVYNVKNPTNGDRTIIAAGVSKVGMIVTHDKPRLVKVMLRRQGLNIPPCSEAEARAPRGEGTLDN